MRKPMYPDNETERLAALHAARILDTAPEETFDRITRLVAQVLNVPIALISLVDRDRQWFKSAFGTDVRETSRDISFCGHALLGSGEFIINDALNDLRFSDNPVVAGAPNIRFYAGIPLRSIDGHALGTLCSIDHKPRQLSTGEIAILHDLAKIAEELIRQRQLAEMTKDLLQSLQQREERYRQLIERSPDAFLIHDKGAFIFINQAAATLLGAQSYQELLGKQFVDIICPEYHDIANEHLKRVQTEKLNAPSFEQEWFRIDGTRITVETTIIPFILGEDTAVQVIARDITEQKREKQQLERLATIDILTGLPNRTLLIDRLNQGILRWQRQQQKAVVAFFGLDHFKQFNDAFGNSTGDQILAAVAKNLRSCLRQSDTGARIGGDEFVLILEDIPDQTVPPVILQRIYEQISQPIWVGSRQVTVGCSVGFSRYPEDGTDIDALLNAANTAMHRAKSTGRGNIQKYQDDMQIQVSERLTLESQLRYAIEHRELLMHYQPKVDLRTGTIVGLEALVRWRHTDLGLISPARFIPAAEESGLIVPIGEWIIREVCWQLKAWQEMQLGHISVAINLSGLQFSQQNLVPYIRQITDECSIDPHSLEFELTESMSMGNPEKSIAIMNELKALGVSLSIDDFGTGYSNLSHLKRFPIDKLKIDQSFINDMGSGTEALAIVQAILALAHSLHLTVVAEGVETREQLATLIKNRCDEMQGYYFSKPLSAVDCTALLLSGHSLALI